MVSARIGDRRGDQTRSCEVSRARSPHDRAHRGARRGDSRGARTLLSDEARRLGDTWRSKESARRGPQGIDPDRSHVRSPRARRRPGPPAHVGGGVKYEDYIARKLSTVPPTGLDDVPQLGTYLFPFQADLVRWALRRGRAA